MNIDVEEKVTAEKWVKMEQGEPDTAASDYYSKMTNGKVDFISDITRKPTKKQIALYIYFLQAVMEHVTDEEDTVDGNQAF